MEALVLILSRRVNERIVVDGPCTITVVDVRGAGARLGIHADPDTKILREELVDDRSIDKERKP
jgi:carbon storage regulator CsrA